MVLEVIHGDDSDDKRLNQLNKSVNIPDKSQLEMNKTIKYSLCPPYNSSYKSFQLMMMRGKKY